MHTITSFINTFESYEQKKGLQKSYISIVRKMYSRNLRTVSEVLLVKDFLCPLVLL